MNILFLGGVFPYEKEKEIKAYSKGSINYASNEFQFKLIQGFRQNGIGLEVISAPFIGSYPNASSKLKINKFEDKDNIRYVSFNNLWGYRNISRLKELKKEVIDDKYKDCNVILVYSPHTPLLEAAIYAKQKNPDIHICLIVPDLPNYMNLNEGKKIIYNFFKKIDIRKFESLLINVDSYVILTKYMKSYLKIEKKPYLVVEAISNIKKIEVNKKCINNLKSIVYTGTLNKKFGVIGLAKAFIILNDQNTELIICGEGEAKAELLELSRKYKNIKIKGQVDIKDSIRYQKEANVLVNPRKNNEDYTKYSFPSKTMEYLMSGNIVVGYKLDGIPSEYDEFIEYVEDESIEKFVEVLKNALLLSLNYEYMKDRINKLEKFILTKNQKEVCSKIAEMVKVND